MAFPGPANPAQAAAAAYAVPINNPGQLVPLGQISAPTLNAATGAAAHFRVACNNRFNLLLNFLRYLDLGDAAAKLLALQWINAAFGCQLLALPDTIPIDSWTSLANACQGVPLADHPHLAGFYQSRNARTALLDIQEIFARANRDQLGAEALEVMKSVVEHHGVTGGVTPDAILNLIRMIRAFPPNSHFPGFPQWGIGDNVSAPANLESHVLKHVCRQPVDLEFGVSETVAWWATLNVRLTQADFVRLAVSPPMPVLNCFDGVNPLAGERLKKFLIYQALANQPAVTQFLKNQALNGYRDYAINHSRAMTNIVVHSNGERVFISGQSGNAFIVGRFEGPVLGISSCYFPLDMAAKLRGAASNMCWALL
jgi:hypothetical protein